MKTQSPTNPTTNSVPHHVAIIMDGNGRWARRRHMPRQAGHRAGIDALRTTVKAADAAGIRVLTVYGFSSENWRRPSAEVRYLMDLMRFFFRREVNDMHANGVRIRFMGERAGLAADICKLMDEAEAKTGQNLGLRLNIAFNYGSLRELSLAAESIIKNGDTGNGAFREPSNADISAHCFDPEMPNADLVIRTGGDQRLSNFLLWQAAEAELYFVEKFWPDFGGDDIALAVDWYREQ